jgi:t-SNARE complex subunit (syntaxin)
MQQELLDLDPQAQQLRAINQIQDTLIQLGQMFSQFSVLVQRQGEQIERIDDQVPNCDHCIVFFTFFF